MSKIITFVEHRLYCCPKCQGTGKVEICGINVRCRRCDGKGRIHGRQQ